MKDGVCVFVCSEALACVHIPVECLRHRLLTTYSRLSRSGVRPENLDS